ncbi:FKBP-type peptidylprolyl isomerase [Pseudoduganella sp. FT55W]|uniref:Peptidyl-prolyl cis-trans isomerase n=1 Tax=Duganella rivi TaxID=2666083 RepID=A0A7X4KCM4_9BURK|nr:FKBP-type peptidyl-prolyl cis-trans isomerase [Duganella rivi]MYM69381.1 FKBP-type peptidylprolyl isomerase [Duganella rivi]
MKSMLQLFAAAACVAALTACGGGTKTIPTTPVVAQPDYKLTTTVTGSGLTAEAGDTVTFHYEGYLYDSTKTDGKGAKVQSTVDAGVPKTGTVGVGALPAGTLPVAAGFDLALLGMQPGGKRTAVLPANLAYGANVLNTTNTSGAVTAPIAANTPMVFDFTMVTVSKAVFLPGTTFTDMVVGTGATAVVGSTVTVTYTGWLYDPNSATHKGTQFDTNVGGTALAFVVGSTQVVTGFGKGVNGMKVGGKRSIVIPPGEGYGYAGSGDKIPGNATLLFEVELLTVK